MFAMRHNVAGGMQCAARPLCGSGWVGWPAVLGPTSCLYWHAYEPAVPVCLVLLIVQLQAPIALRSAETLVI